MLRIGGKLVLFLTLLLMGSYAGAQAPPVKTSDPAKAALIEELTVALKTERTQQQIMQTMQANMLNQFNQLLDPQLKNSGDKGPVDPEKRRQAQADMQDFQQRVFAIMNSHMAWQTMKPVYVAIYDETFTVDELRPLVAFFKSPAGQAYIDKTPMVFDKHHEAYATGGKRHDARHSEVERRVHGANETEVFRKELAEQAAQPRLERGLDFFRGD